MAVQNLGTTYHIGLDFNTIDTTCYALVVVGRADLAKEFMMVTGKPEAEVDALIEKVIANLQAAYKDQLQSAESANSEPSNVVELESPPSTDGENKTNE